MTRNHDRLYRPLQDKQFPLKRILSASVNAKTHDRHYKRYQQWLDWLDLYHSMGNFVPSMKQLKSQRKMIEWINIVGNYMSDVFETTHNIGKTVVANLDSLLYVWQLKGLYLERRSFPWCRRFVRGCNILAQDEFGRRINMPKFAIVNPQLQLMIRTCRDIHVRMGMLLQHRFVMRAEHFTLTDASNEKKVWLKMKNIQFLPSLFAPKVLIISNNSDKNHQINMPMQRTCKCTCHLKWDCVVHKLKLYLLDTLDKFRDPNAPVIGSVSNVLTYSRYMRVVKAICKELKWNAKNYGTHSFRAGGATELHCEGRDPLAIQQFGHWKSMPSVLGYVRPFNTDIKKFILIWDDYCMNRRREVGSGSQNNVIMVNRYIRSG